MTPCVGLGDEGVSLRRPSCQASSPHIVWTTVPSGFSGSTTLARCGAHQDARRRASGGRRTPASARICSTPGRLAGRLPGQVVQGEHRVGLAAAEVGLQLDDRVAALASEALQRAR